MGNAAHAAHVGVKLLFEGDGHGWRSGRDRDALGDRFIVALAEMGEGAVFMEVRRGGRFPGIEVEGCSWVICLFEGWHRMRGGKGGSRC